MNHIPLKCCDFFGCTETFPDHFDSDLCHLHESEAMQQSAYGEFSAAHLSPGAVQSVTETVVALSVQLPPPPDLVVVSIDRSEPQPSFVAYSGMRRKHRLFGPRAQIERKMLDFARRGAKGEETEPFT